MATSDRHKLFSLSIDSVQSGMNATVDSESKGVIADILDENVFELVGHNLGPYNLSLCRAESKLVFRISNSAGNELISHLISILPLRRIIKDYKQMYEAHYEAACAGLHPSRLEAIDMARRALHDEGAQLLSARISPKVRIDFDTARRLFTLVHVAVS
ncbi:UPF0262 family protein [Shinella zoogloeoides]|uniref:UPF0262 family protein n=1 Tax=Shinella zoogloeoides TaxID=352475 RepID=UPI003917E201